MAKNNKKVFITGASGHMGWATFKEIYWNRPDLTISVLIRDSEKNHKLFDGYLNDDRVEIVWGDFGDHPERHHRRELCPAHRRHGLPCS